MTEGMTKEKALGTKPEPFHYKWSGRLDLNQRPQRPERCALAKLSYAPTDMILNAEVIADRALLSSRDRGNRSADRRSPELLP